MDTREPRPLFRNFEDDDSGGDGGSINWREIRGPLQRWLASHVAWVEMSSGVEAEHEVEQNSKFSPESAAWQP